MNKTLALVLTSAALGLSACGSSRQSCMVLANGSQVCGQAAAAWCQLTAGDRSAALANTDPLHNFAQGEALAGTMDECAAIEKRYGGG